MEDADRAVLGRDAELAELRRFIGSVPSGPTAIVFEGDGGHRQDDLWLAGVNTATNQSYRVLSTRAAEAEARLSYTALGDLLDASSMTRGRCSPFPQLQALDGALLRGGSERSRPDQRAVSLGTLEVLRILASSGPVIVAIDDVQWLDAPSARVLAFAVRRLSDEPIGLDVSLRLGSTHPVIRSISSEPCRTRTSGGCGSARWTWKRWDGSCASGRIRICLVPSSCVSIASQEGTRSSRCRWRAPSRGKGDDQSPADPCPCPRTFTRCSGRSSRRSRPRPDARCSLLPSRLDPHRPSSSRCQVGTTERWPTSLRRSTRGSWSAAANGYGSLTRSSPPPSTRAPGCTNGRTPIAAWRISSPIPKSERGISRWPPIDPIRTWRGPSMRPPVMPGRVGHPTPLRSWPSSPGVPLRPMTWKGCARRSLEAAEYHFDAGDAARASTLLEDVIASSPPGPGRAEVLYRLSSMSWMNLERGVRRPLERALPEAGRRPRAPGRHPSGSRVGRDLPWRPRRGLGPRDEVGRSCQRDERPLDQERRPCHVRHGRVPPGSFGRPAHGRSARAPGPRDA